ncbi:ABC transporter permease [Variovorax defluvii]|uniref:ABC transporter permease n=1 Tax=Variovorax defluvii TaxID=913761 RepID=A0ABP8I1L4_9BURK
MNTTAVANTSLSSSNAMTSEREALRSAQRKKRRIEQKIALVQVLLLAVVLAFWELASGRLFDLFWVSRPSLILQYIWDFVQKDFWKHFMFTMTATWVGFAAGAAGGMLAGMGLSRSAFLSAVLDPFLVAINGIPRVALAPLFVVWFGIGLLPKIVLVFTLVFFVMFYNTYSGIKSIEKSFVDLAWVMGANDKAIFRKVVLPAATPYIFLGLKLSIPYALIGAIIGEFVASSAGLGWKIQVETAQYNTTGTMAGLLLLMAIVTVMNALFSLFERRMLRWRPPTRIGQLDA